MRRDRRPDLAAARHVRLLPLLLPAAARRHGRRGRARRLAAAADAAAAAAAAVGGAARHAPAALLLSAPGTGELARFGAAATEDGGRSDHRLSSRHWPGHHGCRRRHVPGRLVHTRQGGPVHADRSAGRRLWPARAPAQRRGVRAPAQGRQAGRRPKLSVSKLLSI